MMTPEDKYALKEFMRGAGVFAATSAILIAVLIALAYFASGDKPLEPSFEVVDKYKECDVVRYAPHQAAEYKYFLHCPK
jgi:hypothetical protein